FKSQHFLTLSFTYQALSIIYTLSLHDALPILERSVGKREALGLVEVRLLGDSISEAGLSAPDDPPQAAVESGLDDAVMAGLDGGDRKSTRLNSSHQIISYAVFCLKKNKA